MGKITIMFLLSLIFLVVPVTALETLTKDNFSTPEISINPEKDYYLPGDEVMVSYIITPKTQNDMILIGGDPNNNRLYSFKTDLGNARWTININYYLGATSNDYTGDRADVEVKYLYLDENRKGVRSIKVNLTSTVPSVSSRIEFIDVVNVSIEEAEKGALPPLIIKVVNTQKFGEDIRKIRSNADSLKSSFESEGVSYNKSEFDQVHSLLDSAQSLVNSGEYLEADEKLKQAEDLLSQIYSQSDRLRAETLRDELQKKLDNAYLNLSVVEIVLEKIEANQNYTKYVQSYVELKGRYKLLKSKFNSADNLISDKKYVEAYNKLKDIKDDVYQLLFDINSLKSNVEAEKVTTPTGGFSLPALTGLKLPFSPLYFAVVIAAVVVAVAVVLKLRRGRRKWDELR